MILNKETNTIIQSSRRQGGNTSFLTNIIEHGTHKWKFKIIKCFDKTGWGNTIGLWRIDNNKKPPTNGIFTQGKDKGYGYCTNIAKLTSLKAGLPSDEYGIKATDGDIVEMFVDMKLLQLSYAVNGTNYGIAYNIEPDKYLAAVNMCDCNDAIQLL